MVHTRTCLQGTYSFFFHVKLPDIPWLFQNFWLFPRHIWRIIYYFFEMDSTYYPVCILTKCTCAEKLKKLAESSRSTFTDISLCTHWWKYIVPVKYKILFHQNSLIFEEKKPNSLTGKMHFNFPWFPEAVGTLCLVWALLPYPSKPFHVRKNAHISSEIILIITISIHKYTQTPSYLEMKPPPKESTCYISNVCFMQ